MRLLIVPALCTLVFSPIIDRHPREPGFQIIYPILIVARACVNNVSLVALVAFAPTSTVSSTPFKSSPTPKLFAIAILLIVTRMNAVIAVGSIVVGVEGEALPPSTLPAAVYSIAMYFVCVPFVLWRRRAVK